MKYRDLIYKTLYDKSRVDGIRLINEDEWPIDELTQLFLDLCSEIIGKDDLEVTKRFRYWKNHRNKIRNTLRSEMKNKLFII